MKKNFLFGTLAVLLAGFWFGGASLADDNVARISSGDEFISLQDAIDNASETDTVTLLDDITLSSNDVIINKNITLDLNGKTINTTNSKRLIFSGEIESTITGNGTITGENSTMNIGSASDHSPEVTIKNGTFVASAADGQSIQNYGKLKIIDATVIAGQIDVRFRPNSSGTILSGIFTSQMYSVYMQNDSKATINNGIFSGEHGIAIQGSNSSLTVNNATVNSNLYGCINLKGPNASLTINDGTFTSVNDYIIFINGTEGAGNNTIAINSGTFITNGYAGIVASNGDNVTLNGGEFIDAGVGILARGGNIKIREDVNINLGGYSSGKTCGAGDAGITVPCGNYVVMDIAAGYPGAATFTVENELGETYVIEGTKANHTGHTVKYGDDESEKTVKLTKSGTSATVTKPTDPTKEGYQFSGWYNGDDAFDFATAISSDVELVSKWNEVIESIEIEGVVDPVAGATPFTGFTVTTGVVLNSTWTGDDDAAFDSFVAGSGYTLTIEIAADTGYVLSGTYTVKVNGESRAVSADTVSKTYQGKFKVTFDGENETLVVSGSTVTAPTVSKECNSLDGWYNGDEKVTFPLTVTGNLALTSKWTYTCSRSSGGGGGSSRTSATTTDTKADTTKADEAKADETKAEETKGNEDNGTNNGNDGAPAPESKYSQEMIDAYNWAFKNGITTMPTIEEADMEGKLTRIAMAKMLSFFAINVLGKTPDTTKVVPNFPDVDAQLDKDYDNGVTLAYQLGIMGIGIEEFRPNDEVTRGEFATALSRLLFNTPDGEGAFYEPHLAKLMEEKIITVDTPDLKELRGYVMIMLMRSAMEK